MLLGLAPSLAGASLNVLVLGDSLSAAYGLRPEQGWVNLLRKRLEGQGSPYQVINASISGDTTSGGLSRLPGLLRTHHPELVIIALGSNDGLRGFGLEPIRANLRAMIAASREAGARVLMAGARVPPNYGPIYSERFFKLFQEVADQEGVPLVPFLLEGVAQDRDLFQADGLHPTAAAQPRILDNLWPTLAGLLDPRAPEL